MEATERLADDLRSHAVDLDRVSGHVRRQILDDVRALEDELCAELVASDPSADIDRQSRSDRLESLLALLALLVQARFQRIDQELQDSLGAVADHAAGEASRLLGDASGHFPQPPRPDEVDDAADPDIEGAKVSAWWLRIAADLTWRLSRALRQGLAVGETLQQLLERIRGTSTGRTMTYNAARLATLSGSHLSQIGANPGDQHVAADGTITRTVPVNTGGVLESTRKNVAILTRTAVHATGNAARMAAFQSSAAPVAAWQHCSIIDSKTSYGCRARAGLTWTARHQPIGHDLPFAVPPLHMSCRSILVPVLEGEEPAPDIGYDEWLRRQPEDVQLEILGPTRYRLFQKGGLTSRDLVDNTGRPLTIEELKKKTRS